MNVKLRAVEVEASTADLPEARAKARRLTVDELTAHPARSAHTLPAESAVTPSAMLEPAGYGYEHGSGLKDLADPSRALPIRMPRSAPRL